jgi:ribosome maturation factor RimP
MVRNEPKIEALDDLCRATVEEAGFDLLLVEWTTDRGRRVLRVYIDHEEAGVTVDDCATVSRRLSHVLDVEEVIDIAYALEVSTPGLDRPLVRERDFARFAGHRARVTLKAPLPTGRKRLAGQLKGVEAGQVSMEVDGELYRFALADVARANLVYQGDF